MVHELATICLSGPVSMFESGMFGVARRAAGGRAFTSTRPGLNTCATEPRHLVEKDIHTDANREQYLRTVEDCAKKSGGRACCVLELLFQ